VDERDGRSHPASAAGVPQRNREAEAGQEAKALKAQGEITSLALERARAICGAIPRERKSAI
jgi:hypothetical protein